MLFIAYCLYTPCRPSSFNNETTRVSNLPSQPTSHHSLSTPSHPHPPISSPPLSTLFSLQKRRCGIILRRLKDRIQRLLQRKSLYGDDEMMSRVVVLRGHGMMHDLVRLTYATVTICR